MLQSIRTKAIKLSEEVQHEFTGSSLTTQRNVEEFRAGIITYQELQDRITETLTCLHGEINFIATK